VGFTFPLRFYYQISCKKVGTRMKKHHKLFVLLLGLTLAACQATPSPPTSNTNAQNLTDLAVTASQTEAPTPVPTATPNPALSAILNEVEGSVEAKDLSEIDFSNAENGRTLQEEGQVRTYEDGYTRIDLSTGTLIRMAPSSYFILVENHPEEDSLFTRIKLEVGQIWVVLNGGSLEVETPSGQAAVRGSYMMVEIDPETQAALVTCLEGNCSLENAAGMVAKMTNGQRAQLQPPALNEDDLELPIIEEMSERDFAEWLFFAPESEDIFPLLEEEGIVPWENWEEYIPEEDDDWFELEENYSDDPLLDGDLLPEGDGIIVFGDGTVITDGMIIGEDGIIIDGDGNIINGDGELLPGEGDGDLLPDEGDGDLLPSDGDLLPGDGDPLSNDGDLLPGDGDLLPGDGDLLPGGNDDGPID
jgi:hypothetical protein